MLVSALLARRFPAATHRVADDREELTLVVAPAPASSFPHGRWILTHFPRSPARLAAYLQQQDEASLMAFSTASRVSPVRF